MSVTRGLIIEGREVAASSGRTTSDINPWTGAVCAEVAAGTPDDVRRAVDAADAAFEAWAATTPAERRRIFLLSLIHI